MKMLMCFTVALSLFVLGCNDLGETLEHGYTTLDEGVDGRILSYPTGQKFKLLLISWIDAGYRWDYVLSDSTVVSVEGEMSYRSNNPDVEGGPATATVHFCAGRPGECMITLFEHQRWMKDVPPRKTVVFWVIVLR